MSASSARRTTVGMAVALCFVLIAGAAVAPRPGSAVAAQSSSSSVLRIGFLQIVDSLNPYIGINDPSYVLTGLLYDYLFSLDQDGNSVPNLAVNAAPSPDATQWTYAIRSGVLWSDGTPLTADDVAFTINYDSQNLNYLWAFEPYLNQVVLCTPATAGRCGAVVSSPGNVTVFFQRPFAAGRALYMPIVQKAQWSLVIPQAAQTTYQNPTPIGTGPFIADPNIFSEFQALPTVPLHVFRNPNYHPVGSHTGAAFLTDIYLYSFTDVTSMELAVMTGSIDLAQFTPSTIGTVRNLPNVLVQTALLATQDFNEIGITQIDTSAADKRLNPARWDVRVRQAMARATNKDFIVDRIYNGYGVHGTSLASPLTPQWWFDPVLTGDNLTYDLQAANALLNVSGYTTWSGGSFGLGYRSASAPITVSFQPACYQCVSPPNVTRTIPAGTALAFTLAVRPPSLYPEEYTTAQYLQAEYARIGIQLTIKLEPTESMLMTDVYGGYVEMYIWYWSADPDPNYILSMESSWTLDGWNDNYWNNASYNAAYLAQLAALDPVARIVPVHAAQQLNYESASYIVYLYPYGEWAMRTDTFTNWGDWAAHPYRQLVTFWGANPLFLELGSAAQPNQPPSTPVIQAPSPFVTSAGTVVAWTGNATDPDAGESLTWTWSWGDNTTSVLETTSAVHGVTTSHAWAAPGLYTVTLTVSDGEFAATSSAVLVEVLGVAISGAIIQPGHAAVLVGTIVELSKGKWSVSFGDGASSSGTFAAGLTSLSLSHTYATAGTYSVVLSVKIGGLTQSASSVVIADGRPPVVTIQGPTLVNATGPLTFVNLSVTATDDVGVAVGPTCIPLIPGALPVGMTTVVCEATDLAGNVGYGHLNVTVRDVSPPIILLPSQVYAEATSAAGAVVSFYAIPADNVGIASGPTCSPASGSLFPLGDTVVHCTATDTSGNVGYANTTVHVIDSTPPATTFTRSVDGNGFLLTYGSGTPSTAAVFEASATDTVGVVGFRCSLDGAPYAACSSSVSLTGLAAGPHVFRIGGIDAAGNFQPVEMAWTVWSPSETVQYLIGRVNTLQSTGNLTARQVNALLAPLNRAYTELQAGKTAMALKDLRTFRDLVTQYVAAGFLSPVAARPLLDTSADLILVLGGVP